jgi:hypothetical protein
VTSREIEALCTLAWEMRHAAKALLHCEPQSLVAVSLLRWADRLDPDGVEEAPVVRLADWR